MKVEIGKAYRTKCGYYVVIYNIYPEKMYAVHGAFLDNGELRDATWRLDGRISRIMKSKFDLVEVGPARQVWINEYEDGFLSIHDAKEKAGECADAIKIRRIRLHRVVLSDDTDWKGEGDE